MNLSGVWQDVSLTMYIEGRDPAYTFRCVAFGTIVSQGVIERGLDGRYAVTGQGINGPVKMSAWLAGPHQLQLQNQAIVDGGILDGFLNSMMPGLGALQPIMTLQRVQPPIQVSPHTGLHVRDDNEQRRAREERARRRQDEANVRAAREEQQKVAQATGPKPKAVESDGDPIEELGRLVGMSAVKEQVEQLNAWAWRQQKLRGHQLQAKTPSLHMSFSGGPGTGKTTVARIIGKLLTRYELLKHGELKEVGRADLVAEFVGQTSPKTQKLIEGALGGVLFIDEAYALSEPGAGGGGHDYGAEALAVLIAEMENHRHELCVIVAGYPEEMERFIDTNAGLASRISRHITFPDFTDQELQEVFVQMAASESLELDPKIVASFQPYIRRARAAAKPRQWGNARTVRNILQRGIENQSLRLRKAGGEPTKSQLLRLELADFRFFNEAVVSIT